MVDESLNNKFERLVALMEAQLEFSRQTQRKEQLRRAQLKEEDTSVLSQSEDRVTVDESMMGDPLTPTLVLHPQQSVLFVDLDKHSDTNYKKYTSPTGPRYLKPQMDPYSKSWDVEIFILKAKAWFRFNKVHEQGQMINHMGAQLEGNTQEWWTSKICINRACEGRLFHDWHYFTGRLAEHFNPRNARMEAYNKLLALCLTSDTPGAATHHVERFRDLEGQVNFDDNDLVIDLF
ncbi:uncharacterized protein UDID_18243 [Ustilago sp. UG-2017a]|nr:uncharacterized protein UDID_18243 [Ustilago sp. UG-2017a]